MSFENEIVCTASYANHLLGEKNYVMRMRRVRAPLSVGA